MALRFYRRLLQAGVSSAELWNNLGLCCFHAGQYDLTLGCFERALALADDAAAPDCWFNIGHVALGIGDLSLAFQAFKVATACDPGHSESLCNLGVLELRKGRADQARAAYAAAGRAAEWMFEPAFNAALLANRAGDYQEAFKQATAALAAYPGHGDSEELLKELRQHFSSL